MMRGFSRPVLVLNGEADEPNRKQEDKLLAALPFGIKQIVKNAGHLANLEQPEVFSEAIRVFARKAAWWETESEEAGSR